MNLVIPDDILRAAQLTEEELLQEVALLLFEQERLTLGYASRLAGMYQGEFMELLASRGLAMHYDVEALEEDVKTLRAMRRRHDHGVNGLPDPAHAHSTR